MRRPFIAGNWKLNLGPREANELAAQLVAALAGRSCDVAVFPTALCVPTVLDRLSGSGIGVGVQEIAAQPKGAYTGTNSAVIARELGCHYALIGHSERRQQFAETDENVNAKVHLALGSGLLPIVCIGETLAQRDNGEVDAVVHAQLAGAFAGLSPDQVATTTLAYEPVWAIGTGRTATPVQAQAVHASIRGWLASNYPGFVADQVRIQYGGSVKPHNAAELLACPDIDGCLDGGASLTSEAFAGIVSATR